MLTFVATLSSAIADPTVIDVATGTRTQNPTLGTDGTIINVASGGQLWIVNSTIGSAEKVDSTVVNIAGNRYSGEAPTYILGALRVDCNSISPVETNFYATVNATDDAMIGSYWGHGHLYGKINPNGHTLTISPQNNCAFEVNSAISGTGTVVKESNGTLNLTGNSDFNGNFVVKEGTMNVTGSLKVNSLQVSKVATVKATSPITVTDSFHQGNSAIFNVSGGNMQLSGDNITVQANITLNGGTLSMTDLVEPTLPSYSGLAVHLDASNSASFDNSSAIRTWYNLADSSNNLTLSNTDGSTQTASVQTTRAGMNVVTFPTAGYTGYQTTKVVDGKTFFIVMADNGKTDSNHFSFLFGNTNNSHYEFHRQKGTTLWASEWADDSVKNGRNVLNGTVVDGTNTNIGTSWDVLSVQTKDGKDIPINTISRDRSQSGRGWRGDMAEVLVYTEALTDKQVKSVSQYLATKWQIGSDIVEPTASTTGDFISTNTITVANDSTINMGDYASVSFGTTTVNADKKLSFNVDSGKTSEWKSEIIGNGSVEKTGTGTLTLTQAPAYTGSTTIEEGTLTLSSGGTLNNLSGGSVDASGSPTTNVTLRSTSTTEKLTLNVDKGVSTMYIGSLYAEEVVKTGDGTFKMYANKGMGQKIVISNFVVAAGRVDMNDDYEGALEIGFEGESNAGVIFSPGNSIGTLTIDGDFTLESGATLLMEVAGANIEDNDQLILKTGSTATFESGSFIQMTLAEGASVAPNEQVSVNLPKGLDLTNVTITSPFFFGGTYDPATGIWSGHVDPNAVPEPSTWALLILGFAGLMKVASCELRVARKRNERR